MTTVYSFKPAFQALLRPIAQWWAVGGRTANQLTSAGLATSVLAGLATDLGAIDNRWLLAVPVLLFARMALNALDGIVAREHGQATARGRLFNEMADVTGDSVAYLPLMFVLPGNGVLVGAIVLLALASEFAAVLDPVGRRNEGPMGKSDRATAFGSITFALGAGIPAGIWTTVALAAVALALVVTISNRLREES